MIPPRLPSKTVTTWTSSCPDIGKGTNRVRARLRRQTQFLAGRVCAGNALSRLGVKSLHVGVGRHGEPIWPPATIGSITHCDGFCAATVAWASDLVAVGIDAERHRALPSSTRSIVLTQDEAVWRAKNQSAFPSLDMLLFSAKESVFKAWFSTTGVSLHFHSVVIELDGEGGFEASIREPVDGTSGRFEGSYLVTPDLIVTAAWQSHART